jgi:hypothetical protein
VSARRRVRRALKKAGQRLFRELLSNPIFNPNLQPPGILARWRIAAESIPGTKVDVFESDFPRKGV